MAKALLGSAATWPCWACPPVAAVKQRRGGRFDPRAARQHRSAACSGSRSNGPRTSPPANHRGVNYNTTEYQRSNAVVTSGAIAAYDAGATGKGSRSP
jgi:hypothetical protein